LAGVSSTAVPETCPSRSCFFQALGEFLERNPDPEILVMSNGVWSFRCKSNQTLAVEEYYSGLKQLVLVNTIMKVRSVMVGKCSGLKHFASWFKLLQMRVGYLSMVVDQAAIVVKPQEVIRQ
jgi:hypothetical protein